jgi:hypothetical protein
VNEKERKARGSSIKMLKIFLFRSYIKLQELSSPIFAALPRSSVDIQRICQEILGIMGSQSLPTESKCISGSNNGIVEKTVTGRSALGSHEVAIRVTHSGVCGTDLHHTHDDMVLGHEGIGVVDHVGSSVTSFKT